MRNIERANERGTSDLGWLSSRFTYSFADYMNPKRMGFGVLRVVNDDTVLPESGFPLHHHAQMEIVTVMLGGTLTHEDSMGNKRELRAGEVQVMTAGTGVNHSEWNHGTDEPVRLLQIWVYPKERALVPRYDQKQFVENDRHNTFQTLVAGVKKEGLPAAPGVAAQASALFIHQDATFSRAFIEKGKSVSYDLTDPEHGLFVFVIEGKIELGTDILEVRDSIEIQGEHSVAIEALADTDVLLIELSMQ